MKKVLAAMSGGVDSGVAALILKEQGYDCIGCTLRLYEGVARTRDNTSPRDSMLSETRGTRDENRESTNIASETGVSETGTSETGTSGTGTSEAGTPETGTPGTGTPGAGTSETGTSGVRTSGTGAGEQESAAARALAGQVGILHFCANREREFAEKVISPFIKAYEEGRTPNPCVECNRFLKFGALFEEAAAQGCDYVATGHYAIIEEKDGEYFLKKAADSSRDQSYVLYTLTQEKLSRTLFPLGGLTKLRVRELAAAYGLACADRPDSQDICFVPDGDYGAFIEQYTGKCFPGGDFTDSSGNRIAGHRGIIHYTVGQRRGLGIASTEPYYVLEVQPETNRVVLGRSGELFKQRVMIEQVSWIAGKAPEEAFGDGFRAQVKLRYRHKEQPALVRMRDRDRAEILFDEPQRAPTPGQSAVIYDGDYVLGGGLIVRTGLKQ